MHRTFRYPLHPTVAQATIMSGWLVHCQQLYNAALQHRRDAWEHEKRQRQLAEDRGGKRPKAKMPSYVSQSLELTDLRANDYDDVPVIVQRSALRRIDRAFQAFFRRVKSGAKPGHPRFKARDRYNSFDIGRVLPSKKEGTRDSRSARIRVPTLGLVRFHEYRPLKGVVRNVTIRRTADRWFVCFSCDIGEAPEKTPVATATGIDVGLTTFATLSNGDEVENPRYFRKAEAQLAMRQQRLARRKRGSKGRGRAKTLVAKAHEHIRQQRLNFARQLACTLFATYDMVAYEDLNIRGMAQGPLSKSIHDAAWGTFIHALTCKAEEAGKWAVAVDPRGTTIRCSGCDTRVPKTLAEREHRCSTCGLVLGRDENAARNVLTLGRSAVSGHAQA